MDKLKEMTIKSPRHKPQGVTNKLKKIRYAREYYQQNEFAKLLGVTPQALGLWERNQTQPSIASAMKICKLLDLDLYDLFDIVDEPTENTPITKAD